MTMLPPTLPKANFFIVAELLNIYSFILLKGMRLIDLNSEWETLDKINILINKSM